MYLYAWDLVDEGVSAVSDELRSLNLNTITLAGSYHAGKFLRPHGRSGKVYFPEDGTAYFKTDPDRYGAIAPVENSLVSQEDPFLQCCALDDMAVNAWMVLLHNTLLGTRHSDACVENAFGDRYVYSLCPANPNVREYAINLCADISARHPISGLSLETPGYLPFEHGFHHEFALLRQNSWVNRLLGLCFCQHCVAGAAGQGIASEPLRRFVAETLEQWFSGDVDIPEDMAGDFWCAQIVGDPELHSFLRWRCDTVTSLVGDIRSAVRSDVAIAVIPSVARPTCGSWYEGSDLSGLTSTADAVEACFYEPSVDRIRADLADVSRRCGGISKLRAIVRPGPPDLENAEAVVSAVKSLVEAGVRDIAFYNYGHLKRTNLSWIGQAIGGLQ